MADIPQPPQESPEQQAARQLFLFKKQVFMQAVLQAMIGGMKSFEGCDEKQFDYLVKSLQTTAPTVMDMTPIDYMIKNGGYVTIIMSHEFAQAFWGDGEKKDTPQGVMYKVGQPTKQWDGYYPMPAWQYNLMQLSITPDKFRYLHPFLKPLPQKQEWK